jgi:hypothetical protein
LAAFLQQASHSEKKEEKMKKIASLLIIVLLGVAINADAKQKNFRKFYLTWTFSMATKL